MTKLILFDDKSIHIEGYKNIVNMEKNQIRINCGKKILNILGKELKIEILTSIELNIYGKICNIFWD
ncbi:MAG: hypothetical protein E7258_04875 [Lachnospiraceae bacterium]|nr:hypothetical protein [Lachnospiraceae bacterium]